MNTIRIDRKTGFAYIPKEIREDGFEGDIDTISNTLTLILVKPGIPLESIVKSLLIAMTNLQLQIEQKKLTEIDKTKS